MLPARLLVYRLQADRIVPSFLSDQDHPWLRALLDERERFVGTQRREYSARSQEPLPIKAPPRKRALAAHVLEQLAAPLPRRDPPPRQLRAELFTAAAAIVGTRDDVVARVAARLGLTVAALEAGLFGDLPDLQPVSPLVRSIAPVDLGTRANLALARGLLARADRVTVEIEGNALPIVRLAKLRGLIVTVGGVGGRTQLELSGPMSLFHHTRIYGRRLGEIVPLLCWCMRFRLQAKCVLPDGLGEFQLATGDPIFPAEEPKRYDSMLEADFARSMRRAAPDWDLIRDPEPLRAGDRLAFPDFALAHREDRARRWLIEIVGFWTPEYLVQKLAAYRAAKAPNLVLCIDDRRGCAEGDLPAGARIVRYRRRIDPQAVLAVIGEGQTEALTPAAPRAVIEPIASDRMDVRRSAASEPSRDDTVLDPPLLEAIRDVASRSPYGNAFLPLVEGRLRRRIALTELIALCRTGRVALNRPTADIAIRPLATRRAPIPVTRPNIENQIAAAIEALRRFGRPPLYHLVREYFDWLADDGADLFRPVVEALAQDGLLSLGEWRGRITIDVAPS